ncbi:MAG: intradiol ring-cleavage dioxygenase [Microbacteriaceae bacterium]|nr:intradiol ring-cleavage dioxygenase [Microbacteriaceae bacterium]
MTGFPEPDPTPNGPAYQGRLLKRPDEEVVDQGIAFDLATLVSRRNILTMLGLGAGSVLLAACASPSPTATTGTDTGTGSQATGEIPDETAGPYPGDGSNGPDVLEEARVIRSDIRSSIGGGATAEGVPTRLTLTILDQAGGDIPFEGVAVYVWHCDAQGRYSLYSEGVTEETYLRGVQIAGADGTVTFTTIFPGCYSGRWPHIHFEVYPDASSITDSANAIATSQVALPEDASSAVYALGTYPRSAANLAQTSLTTDNVFGDDGGALQLATVTGDATSGYEVALTVRVDTRTTPSLQAAPGGGQGGGMPGGGPGEPPDGAPPQ